LSSDVNEIKPLIENRHSTDVEACLASRVNAHTDARRRRRRRFNVGRVLVLNSKYPPCPIQISRLVRACFGLHVPVCAVQKAM
jgi:hypothetical protein